jgi:hypothetical protein
MPLSLKMAAALLFIHFYCLSVLLVAYRKVGN